MEPLSASQQQQQAAVYQQAVEQQAQHHAQLVHDQAQVQLQVEAHQAHAQAQAAHQAHAEAAQRHSLLISPLPIDHMQQQQHVHAMPLAMPLALHSPGGAVNAHLMGMTINDHAQQQQFFNSPLLQQQQLLHQYQVQAQQQAMLLAQQRQQQIALQQQQHQQLQQHQLILQQQHAQLQQQQHAQLQQQHHQQLQEQHQQQQQQLQMHEQHQQQQLHEQQVQQVQQLQHHQQQQQQQQLQEQQQQVHSQHNSPAHQSLQALRAAAVAATANSPSAASSSSTLAVPPNNLISISPTSPTSEPLLQEIYECPLSSTTVAWRAHFGSIQPHLARSLFTLGDTLGTGTFGRVRLVHYCPASAISAIRAAGVAVEEQLISPALAHHTVATRANSHLLASPTGVTRSSSVIVSPTHAASSSSTSTTPGPRYFALKMLKKSEILRLKQVDHIKAEKAILSRIAHPYIISLYGSFQDEHNLCMVMEYVIGGELFSQLRKVGRFSADVSRFYAAEIVLALQYLHSKDIVYRDLKPENLLIDSEGHIKITDFGFAKVVQDRTWTLCGTPEYLAPEIIQSKGHNKAVDWWALGILIFEMLAGYPPFYDENPFGIYQKILSGKIEFPKSFDPVAKDLVRKLLTPDRTMRFGCLRDGAEDVKRHRWFKGLDWFRVFTRSYKPPFVPAFRAPNDTSNFDRYPDSQERVPVPLQPKEKEQFLDF